MALKILYMYTELMGYQIPILREYTQRYGAEVHVVHWDHKKLTPYKPPVIDRLRYYNRSECNRKDLHAIAEDISPDLVFISGWQDRDYLSVARSLRKKRIPVVAGFDDQWKGTLRQMTASVSGPLLLGSFFSHAWVTGPYQYEFARNIGFKKPQIIFNCYSADLELFNAAHSSFRDVKSKKYPHRFLFVGRYETVKGVDLLLEAWSELENVRKNWELRLIGNGSLGAYLRGNRDIAVMDFMQPENLIDEVGHSGCFVLPSRDEPWGVVLHEFAAAGLPIICSDVCGAAPYFVTQKLNGYIFKSGDCNDLRRRMLQIIETTDAELFSMSQEAHGAGQKITPQISAASFLSILD